MKILKKKDLSNWSYKHTCYTCESELEVEKDDLKYLYYEGDQREPSYTVYQFECPVCHQASEIPDTKIPKLIQIETKNKRRA